MQKVRGQHIHFAQREAQAQRGTGHAGAELELQASPAHSMAWREEAPCPTPPLTVSRVSLSASCHNDNSLRLLCT